MRVFGTLAKWLAVPLALALGFAAWLLLSGPAPPPEMDALVERAVGEAVAQAARSLAAREEPRRLYLTPLAGDVPTGRVSWLLRDAVSRLEGFQVLEVPEEASAGVTDLVSAFLGTHIEALVSPARARARALQEAARAEGLVVGQVRLADGAEEVRVALDLELVDAAAGRTIASMEGPLVRLEKSWFALPYYRYRVQGWAWWARLGGWLVFILGLPFALVPVLRPALRARSNAVNGAFLAGLTAVDALLAAALTGLDLGGVGGVALVLVAAVAAGAWNFGILDELEEAWA
ncbi:MAG: hypothetical protein HY722_07525 [Planctomycetes bacterium]|nr:hypothetical protein [Planctomycetota bacterium]